MYSAYSPSAGAAGSGTSSSLARKIFWQCWTFRLILIFFCQLFFCYSYCPLTSSCQESVQTPGPSRRRPYSRKREKIRIFWRKKLKEAELWSQNLESWRRKWQLGNLEEGWIMRNKGKLKVSCSCRQQIIPTIFNFENVSKISRYFLKYSNILDVLRKWKLWRSNKEFSSCNFQQLKVGAFL